MIGSIKESQQIDRGMYTMLEQQELVDDDCIEPCGPSYDHVRTHAGVHVCTRKPCRLIAYMHPLHNQGLRSLIIAMLSGRNREYHGMTGLAVLTTAGQLRKKVQ